MKKLVLGTACLALGLALSTPATAGPRGYGGGHYVIGRGPFVHRPYRPRFAFSFGFGSPGFFYGSVYRPAPYVYAPYPVYVPPPDVWVPGHYVYDYGERVYIEGHWSRRGW